MSFPLLGPKRSHSRRGVLPTSASTHKRGGIHKAASHRLSVSPPFKKEPGKRGSREVPSPIWRRRRRREGDWWLGWGWLGKEVTSRPQGTQEKRRHRLCLWVGGSSPARPTLKVSKDPEKRLQLALRPISQREKPRSSTGLS